YVYDAGSRRTSLTDPDSNVTSWAYDGLNRVTTETNALSKVESFGYNAAGDVTSRTDRNGRVTNYGYDNLHRRTQEQWMSGSTVLNTFGYNFDAASQLTSASATGTQMTYTFDNLGRVLTASNSGTTNIPTTVQTNVYDANSRRTQQTATVASVADYKNTWTWDNANRQTQVKQESQSGGISVAEKRVDFTYNTGGLFTGVKRYNDLAGTQIVANTTYTYDLLARLTALDHKNASGGNLSNYTWTFDNDRRITNFTNIDGYSNYTYDSNDQVTVVDHSYQTDETYTYDANGNRTNTGYTTSTNNRLTSDGTYNYTYDDEGNRISRTKISDSTKVEYTWDHRNRLTDVVFKNSGGTVTKKVQYQYDVFDRRIGKRIDADGNGAYESATYWVYDDAGKRDPNTGTQLDDIVLEFNDADGDGTGLATLTTRYLHGPQFDQVLASEAASGNVVTWALADHQGTVRDMVRYASGTTTVVNHRKFDAFGNLTAESDATVKFLYSYTGREWDGDAGLYYYRARWYDAKIGRFISEDPMGFAAGDTNITRYVGNNMPNATDPSGFDWLDEYANWFNSHGGAGWSNNVGNAIYSGTTELGVSDEYWANMTANEALLGTTVASAGIVLTVYYSAPVILSWAVPISVPVLTYGGGTGVVSGGSSAAVAVGATWGCTWTFVGTLTGTRIIQAALLGTLMHAGRAQAIKKAAELQEKIEIHFRKLGESPLSRDVNHWKTEIGGWMKQINEYIRHMPRKTAQPWIDLMKKYREMLETY
ncbi:MAG: hypothetical protein NTX48_07100, partial [Planctomycetales bacterium]|nr:hypothetical protein [Planctomycetales bacterium]